MDPVAGTSSASVNNPQKQINGSSFKDAVKGSEYVDTTLLIAELLQHPRVIIFAPRRFGMSMNMDMVKCFFQIELGRDITTAPKDLEELNKYENFQAFRRCKILNETDLVKEHFGRHPVLHIDFKDVKVSSVEVVEDGIRDLVSTAYLEHSYLAENNIFANSTDNELAKQNCKVWCNMVEYKKKNAVLGLRKLIEYLHAYHKRKVYLLIDEFDIPAVLALLAGKDGDEVKNIINQVIQLLGAVVKGPTADKYLLGALITGASYFGSIGISDHSTNVAVYKWLLEFTSGFVPYYSVGDDYLTELLERVFPDQERKQLVQKEMRDVYNGYHFTDKPPYCLWPVLFYVTICGLNDFEMNKCAIIFRDMSFTIPTNDENVKKILQDFHEPLKILLSIFKENDVNEYSIQAAMYVTMLKAGYKECHIEKSVTHDKETGRIDLWMCNNDFAVIWEFKYDRNRKGDPALSKKSSERACREIIKRTKKKKVPYVKILKQCPSIKNYLLIGLSVDGECIPYMCCLLNNKNPERFIFFP